jgi:hypothetical protein
MGASRLFAGFKLNHQGPSVRFREVVRAGPHLLLAGRSEASIGLANSVPKLAKRPDTRRRSGQSHQRVLAEYCFYARDGGRTGTISIPKLYDNSGGRDRRHGALGQ